MLISPIFFNVNEFSQVGFFMHIAAFSSFGNVSRSKIQGHITFFAMIFFGEVRGLLKFGELYFMNHTKNSRGRPRITLRPYLIISMQELNDFRLLVLSREFGFVINLVKKQVAKTTA